MSNEDFMNKKAFEYAVGLGYIDCNTREHKLIVQAFLAGTIEGEWKGYRDGVVDQEVVIERLMGQLREYNDSINPEMKP